jgi:UDP-N-acetylmuramate--alanine ligase
MKALAELLTGLGWRVTGSDQHLSETTAATFARRGLRIHRGHQEVFVPRDADLLVYSPAVDPANPERQQAAELRIPQLSFSQMLGKLMEDKVGISIAGTHGKSTTTAMTACVLEAAGLNPSAIVGAELCNRRVSGWAGPGPHFVVESCEFRKHFLDLTPRVAAILSIEPDHFDCYPGLGETVSAFSEFAERVPENGCLLIRGDSAAARQAIESARAPVSTFSLTPDADWWAADLRRTADGLRFRVFHQGEYFSEIALRVPGEHNVLNALAATAVCHAAGASPVAIREGLDAFTGIRRRFEIVGSFRGVLMIDDYAHHPTAVRATLRTAREQFPARRIWCVFQPHQVSRTQALLAEFAESFHDADEVLVLPVFAARERVGRQPEQTSSDLARRIASEMGRARYSPALDRALATLEDELRAGDVLITMGAGDIGQVHDAFTRRLQRHHASR